MQKLKINKGFTMIEIICSLAIFSMLFLFILSVQLNNLRLKKYNENLHAYIAALEALKNDMLYNTSFTEIEEEYHSNMIYIKGENIKIDKIKNINFEDLFVSIVPSEKPYIKLNLEEGEVLKVKLQLYIKNINKDETIECEFFKGKYL